MSDQAAGFVRAVRVAGEVIARKQNQCQCGMRRIDPGIDNRDDARAGDLVLALRFSGPNDLIGGLIEIAVPYQSAVIVHRNIILERLGDKAQGRSHKTQQLVHFYI